MLTRCLSLALTRNSRGGSKHPLYFASNTQIYGNKPRFKINRIDTFYLIGFNAKSDANCQQVRGLKSDKSHPAPELYGAQVGSDRVREQSLSLCPGNIWSALPATSLPPPPTLAVMSDRRAHKIWTMFTATGCLHSLLTIGFIFSSVTTIQHAIR